MAMELAQNLVWVPFERVGGLRLGMPYDEAAYSHDISRILDEESENVGWQVYGDLEGRIRVYVERGVVCSVGCHGSCEYCGRELIGMRIAELLSLMGYPPDLKRDDLLDTADGPEEVYELEGVGAQVWVREGQVVTVICDPAVSGPAQGSQLR